MFTATTSAVVLLSCFLMACAQQVGRLQAEDKPAMPLCTCKAAGCTCEELSVTLDANWRWVHDGQGTNCYKGSEWNPRLCPDPDTCAEKCHVEGISQEQYVSTYGVHAKQGGLTLDFITKSRTGGAANAGSRLYLMETDASYKIFKLKNREFTFTVDVSRLPCGLNGAVYFVEMDADGGKAAKTGANAAGAMYGTGYCDAQCPHDIKFINGRANTEGWNSTAPTPIGNFGSCCAEMDIWEANSRATAYTPHPCSITGSYLCEGDMCGDTDAGKRYEGVCDKDGCDFAPFRLGNKTFYGRQVGSKEFTLDTKKKMTVVTQFITSDGTDEGDLVDIRRFYMQDGQLIPNANSSIKGVAGNSITDAFCHEAKEEFGDVNDFAAKGGMKAMGEALDRGMVLALSLWDDNQAHMLWLDSVYPRGADPSIPGVLRGPCSPTSGKPENVRQKYPHASVTYRDLKIGEIGTTLQDADNSDADAEDDEFGGDDRRLDEHVML